MRWFIASVLAVCYSTSIQAHFPDREHKPVHQRIDLIGPLGTRLPMSYRRQYNRPTNLGGRIAYLIAPSSQEAMAWHEANHRGDYKNHRPRIEKHYFYPKPWEALRIGPRTATKTDAVYDQRTLPPEPEQQDLMELPKEEPIKGQADLIEQ